MPFAGAWCKIWIYFGFVFAWTKGARPRFDTSTDMGSVLVPADAEVDSVIFRLRATDQDADFPLVFEITATITPVVRIDNLPCTLYNKVCQANVILTKRLVPGRLHDFAVRVRDTKGDSNSMQATISATNATTPRDKIFPHIPSLIMVPEDTKPGKELDYLLVRANSWSGKPVYIELWQPKELFTIRQRQTPTQTKGVITLIGELDFETQSVYTLTMYATDPYTEPGKDTRNIAGLNVAVVVTDVQDVPPIFTLAPPLTRINNSIQPGDIVLRVHAEDGDKGVPREIVYGLVSEGNAFTPFFNISEATGEIILARPLEELTQITHVGAPVVLTVVAEELRRSREEPPAQATVVDVGFLLGEPGNSPPYFESDNYVAKINENLDPGTVINFGDYSTKVKDEDIGKAGVFALKLENNNGTFEINPTVAERTADFIVIVRDNTLIDYELYKTLSFKIIAQEVGPATNLSASVPVTIFLQDVNDNPPVFDEKSYEVTLSENVTGGSRVVQVHATDVDTGSYGETRYTGITGEGSEAFTVDPDTGLITVAMGSSLDRETAARLSLSVEARDENGSGNKGVVPLIIDLLDVNDNAPVFEKDAYDFTLNPELTNFTSPAFIKAVDADAEPPNNAVKYELIHGNYENKFYLNETSGELILRSPITRIRRKKQSSYDKFAKRGKEFVKSQERIGNDVSETEEGPLANSRNRIESMDAAKKVIKRRRRASDDALYTLTARAYDLGIPHLSSVTKIRIISGIAMEARIMMFVVPGEQPNSTKTAETLATITGGRVTVLETRPYIQQNQTGSTNTLPGGGKKSIIIARVEQTEPGTPLVDVEKIRETLAANGVGIIGGGETVTAVSANEPKTPVTLTPPTNDGQTTIVSHTITHVQSEDVTVYKAENKLLFWLLIILGLLMLLAIAALIICCTCPGCPFYMAPRKRRVHSSETLIARADGRPKRHLHRQPAAPFNVSWNGRKQAWSADPTRRNWQFNKRNVKNCSLPGDVAFISGQPNDVHMNAEAPRLRDTSYDHSRRSRMDEQERMYMEEVDGQRARGYDPGELDSLQRHEVDRGSDVQRQGYRQRYMEPDMNEGTAVREQHFYREGNAEVLRLVTRGQAEDTTSHHYHHHPTTLIVDGKDIILQRFIEDQKSRHDLSMQEIEVARVMDQRTKEACQQQAPEIILIPDRLDLGTRQHMEEIGPNIQRLVIDHGDYGSQKMEMESQMEETLRQERQLDGVAVGVSDRPSVIAKDHVEANKTQYSLGELELAKQKTLLARLLLKREHRQAEGGIVDSASYLETQSLPGQVAIATQTDRTTATQTERQVRSRSDNDESDEDSRYRKKLKSRKKYGEGDWRRTRTLWMKSPIEEEASPRFDKRLNILRKKVREVKEDRKISLEPEVLREISDSLDGNGSSYKGEEDESIQTYRKSTEQTSISYKILNEKENGSPCSTEVRKSKLEKDFIDKNCEDTSDYHKMNGTESTSSPEMKIKREKQGKERVEERSPKKDVKPKASKKSEGMIKPSFKILEKEFTMLTKKLSKLGDKKFQESTGSDSTSQEKLESKDPKKDLDQKPSKKPDASSSQRQATESTSSASKSEKKGKQKKEAVIAKTKQKLKYQQTHVMSTGSSEYDDVFDRTKRQSGPRQESVKQKQSVGGQGHFKVKRQMHVDRRDAKKQMTEFREEELERKKDGATKETLKSDSKAERTGKVTRAPKLASVARRDNIAEETTTSTNSDQAEGRKDAFALPVPETKDSSDSWGKGFNGVYRQDKQPGGKDLMQRFSDDFVENAKVESVGQGMISEKGKQGKEEKVQVASEEKLSENAKAQLKENGLKNMKSSVQKHMKTEEQVQEKGRSTAAMAEDSKIFRDVAQEVIISSVVNDIIESKERKKSGPSETETTGMEELKEFKKEGEILLDVLTATNLSGKNEETVDKQKQEMTIKGKGETIQVEQSFEDAENQMYKNKDAEKEHVQKSGVLDEVQRHGEKLSKDDKRKDTPVGDSEKEMKREMKQEVKKQEEVDLLPTSSKTDAERNHSIETEEKGGKLEVEMQNNGKIDVIQKTEQLVEENVKNKLSSDEKDSKRGDMADEAKKFSQKEKQDLTKNKTADRKEENVSVEVVKSPSKREEISSETDGHQIKEKSFLNIEEKSKSAEEAAVLKPEPEKSGNKIKEEAAEISEKKFVLPDKEETLHQQGKAPTEIEIDGDVIKEKESDFLDQNVDHEGQAVIGTKVKKKEDILLDKEKKILTDITTEDNQIDTQENILSGTEKLSDEKEEAMIKEIKLDDPEISEKGNIFLDEEKQNTDTETAEALDKKGEEHHDKEERIATKMETVDDQQLKIKESIKLEISKAEDYHLISEERVDSLKTEQSDSLQQEIIPKTSDVSKDDTSPEKSGSSETSTINEQNIQKDKAPTEIPTPPDHNIEKETSIEEKRTDDHDGKKEGFLSEMFKAVHVLTDKLTDKLTSSQGSINASTEERESEATKSLSHSDDQIIGKETPSLSTDNKDKDHVEISDTGKHSASPIDNQSLKQVEEKVSTEDTKVVAETAIPEDKKVIEMTEKDSQVATVTDPEKEEIRVKHKEKEAKEKRSVSPEDGKMTIEWKEMIEKDLKIDVIVHPEDKGASIQAIGKEVKPKPLPSPTVEKVTSMPKEIIETDSKTDTIPDRKGQEVSKETPKVLEEQVKTLTQEVDERKESKSSCDELSPKESEKQHDALHAKAKELVEKALSESIKRVELHHDTTDDKLEPSSETEFHEPPIEASDSSLGRELPQTSMTPETTKEKFAFDSIAPETPAASRKIVEAKERFESGNEETELREADQFAEKQTSAAKGDKTQPFLEQQLQEQDLPMISPAESGIEDAIEKRSDEAFALEDMARGEQEPLGEEYPDVSLPLFTSIIRTVDDSDDSDSSSDISRKTTLTTRPYQTPRHKARQSPEGDNVLAMEGTDTLSIGDEEEGLAVEVEEDQDVRSLEDDQQSKDVEDTIEEKFPETVSVQAVKDTDPESKEKAKTPPHEEAMLQSASSNEKQGAEQLVSKANSKFAKQTSKDDSPPAPKRAEAESLKPSERKMKEINRRRVPFQRKKKSTSEESSEEKAGHSQDHARYRPRKKLAEDQPKQKDSDQAKQSKKTVEELRRKQSISKMKLEKDRRASSSSEKQTVPLKTGEIDTSKAQPKYMAWYKKNREEMEKRRAELRATDDEEQLPRWLRRSMRSQKSEKEDKKKSEQKAADTTPKSKRKIKPLVNVESEQLKAIVRQGRKLRRAEGGREEDPPVQIFATSPPAQPPTDTKHHLVQHSEYKYEKIPAPFYLHPPPAPHPSPQMSPDRFDVQPAMEHGHEEDFDSGIAISIQGGNRLRHQQLLEKKSVFDIAYSEAAPPQLRADSTTPPS